MSKEELKACVINQVEKLAPQQADMIKENIDINPWKQPWKTI